MSLLVWEVGMLFMHYATGLILKFMAFPRRSSSTSEQIDAAGIKNVVDALKGKLPEQVMQGCPVLLAMWLWSLRKGAQELML